MPRVLTLEKSLSLLEAVMAQKGGIGTRALAQLLKINVATAHNIAQTFCHRGYLHQDPVSKNFSPGIRLALLGRHASSLQLLSLSASPILEELAAHLNESILLGAIDHERIINLKYIPSSQALRIHEPEDVSANSYCTAFGKMLLSSFSPEKLDHYLRHTKLQAFTPKTICDPGKIRKELAKTKSQDFASTCDEHSEGVSAVAVPIRNPWKEIVAALGASAPTMRMQKSGQFEESLAALRKAAAKIEAIWNQNSGTQGGSRRAS